MAGLTALQIKNAKPGRYADGKGLYLLVGPTGSKSWVLRVQVDGRRRDYGLGSLDLVKSLAEARQKAEDWRKLAKEGHNPSAEAKRQRASKTTFEDAAQTYYDERKASWKNGKHQDQWINTLKTYAYPSLGKLSVDSIDAHDVAQALLPIWGDKGETARRVKQRIGSVLDYSNAKGWRASEAPMRAVGTLLKGIRQPKQKNFAAMPYKQVAYFMPKLSEAGETVGRLGLQFLILTAARSGEVRGALWSEIDLKKKVWTIPASRMKMDQEHQVPLSDVALALLEKAKAHSVVKPEGLVFPGLKRKPLSDMTLSKVLRSNGGEGFTVHGFRSSFKDWASEQGYPSEWSEAALAHTVANRVEAAYRRTKFLEQRIKLMKAWSDFCVKGARLLGPNV